MSISMYIEFYYGELGTRFTKRFYISTDVILQNTSKKKKNLQVKSEQN